MLWLLFAIISLVSSGFAGIIHRHVLRDYDWLSYAFITGILTSIVFLPPALSNFTIPADNFSYLILLDGILLWTLISAVTTKSFQYIEASERAPLKQSQIIFLLILSYALLKESLTFNKIFGSLLIFLGVILISYRKGQTFGRLSEIGTQLTLLAAALTATVSIVDKIALKYWNTGSYSFFTYLFPSLIFGVLVIKKGDQIKKLIKFRLLPVIVSVVLQAAYYYSRLLAFSLTDVSNVFPILRLSVLVGVVGGIIFLKEKENVPQKILSAIIMISGAWMVAK